MTRSRAGSNADPEPAIVELLRRVYAALDDGSALKDDVGGILGEWNRTEDIASLRSTLGVQTSRKRRRVRTVRREQMLAASITALRRLNQPGAMQSVCTWFNADEREVQRAEKAWRDTVDVDVTTLGDRDRERIYIRGPDFACEFPLASSTKS